MPRPATPPDTFGSRSRSYRERAGFTLQEVANRAGLSRGRIAQLEQDSANPVRETVERIAEALGVRPLDLDPSYPLICRWDGNTLDSDAGRLGSLASLRKVAEGRQILIEPATIETEKGKEKNF